MEIGLDVRLVQDKQMVLRLRVLTDQDGDRIKIIFYLKQLTSAFVKHEDILTAYRAGSVRDGWPSCHFRS